MTIRINNTSSTNYIYLPNISISASVDQTVKQKLLNSLSDLNTHESANLISSSLSENKIESKSGNYYLTPRGQVFPVTPVTLPSSITTVISQPNGHIIQFISLVSIAIFISPY